MKHTGVKERRARGRNVRKRREIDNHIWPLNVYKLHKYVSDMTEGEKGKNFCTFGKRIVHGKELMQVLILYLQDRIPVKLRRKRIQRSVCSQVYYDCLHSCVVTHVPTQVHTHIVPYVCMKKASADHSYRFFPSTLNGLRGFISQNS